MNVTRRFSTELLLLWQECNWTATFWGSVSEGGGDVSMEGEGRCCVTVSTLTLTCGEGIVVWRNGLGGGEAEIEV
jgi:hypothetical protein